MKCTIYDELAAMASAAADGEGKGGAAAAKRSRPLPQQQPDKLRRQAVSPRQGETASPSGERPNPGPQAAGVQLGLFDDAGATEPGTSNTRVKSSPRNR